MTQSNFSWLLPGQEASFVLDDRVLGEHLTGVLELHASSMIGMFVKSRIFRIMPGSHGCKRRVTGSCLARIAEGGSWRTVSRRDSLHH